MEVLQINIGGYIFHGHGFPLPLCHNYYPNKKKDQTKKKGKKYP